LVELMEMAGKALGFVAWSFRATEGWSWAFCLTFAAVPAYFSYELWVDYYIDAAKILAGMAVAIMVVKLVLFVWQRARQPGRPSQDVP
jgi:hypothetical protein